MHTQSIFSPERGCTHLDINTDIHFVPVHVCIHTYSGIFTVLKEDYIPYVESCIRTSIHTYTHTYTFVHIHTYHDIFVVLKEDYRPYIVSYTRTSIHTYIHMCALAGVFIAKV